MKILSTTLDELKKTIASLGIIELKLAMVKQALGEMSEDIVAYDDNIVRQRIDTMKIINEHQIHITFKDGFEYTQALNPSVINTLQIA